MANYTVRVTHRAELAQKLKTEKTRAAKVGLKEADLDVIIESGEAAAVADREQGAQLTEQELTVQGRSESVAAILARGDELRDRLPATVESLAEGGHEREAKFLASLSYARYRMRDLPLVDPALADDPAVKKVQRVEREDRLTRLSGLAALAGTIATRAAIVAELTERGIDREKLEQLARDADAEVRAGKNTRMAAEATARESAAVTRQKAKWLATRRMIRRAVAGDAELEKLYAQC